MIKIRGYSCKSFKFIYTFISRKITLWGIKMEQKFNISGTPEELQLILEKEFELSAETASVAAAVFVFEQNQEQDHEQLEEDTLWFLNDRKAEYQSHIFSIRYTISFSKAMLDVLDELLVPGILVLCGAGELAILSEILYSIKALMKNLRRVKENECCVYFQTLQYLKTHSSRWFSVDQVTPCIGDEAVCVNLDKKWKCKFRCHEDSEKCNIQLKDVKDILNTFCNDAVMESNEMGTLYKYKF